MTNGLERIALGFGFWSIVTFSMHACHDGNENGNEDDNSQLEVTNINLPNQKQYLKQNVLIGFKFCYVISSS